MSAPSSDPSTSDANLIAESIASDLSVAMPDVERVTRSCAALQASLRAPLSADDVALLRGLGALLRSRSDQAAAPLADLLEAAAAQCADPWLLLEPLVGARDRATALQALALAGRLAGEGRLSPGPREVRFLASVLEEDPSPLDHPTALAAIASFVRAASGSAGGDPVEDLLLACDDLPVRVLAARILDLEGDPAPPARASHVLGDEACSFLRPYLDFTRAGHLDLVHLAPNPGQPPPALDGLRRAEATCGEKLLREIVAALGWARLGLGFEAVPLAAIRVDRAPPLFLSPAESPLFERCALAHRGEDRILAVAHGGLPSEAAGDAAAPIARYRAYNLAHAEALQEILDVAPLAAARLTRLVALLDRLVDDHVALFAALADECAILPAIWQELRARIVEGLEREPHPASLSADLTRLVLGFEDPSSAGTVTTLHGLKRFLHQRGLRLGFHLVKAVAATRRSVDVLVASRERVLGRLETIRYVDFEPEARAPGDSASIPYPVWIVAQGFARQLLHGHASFPSARIFCYGNEVHYYLTYGTHPALVRIDFGPPLQGGMVDLEFYGVSRYHLDAHPNRELDAVRCFFRRLEFDVSVEPNTRVHARYDKERARNLGDLCAKAESLFRLAPYLMDLDWTLGDLRVAPDARETAADAWSGIFERWGAIPLDRILSKDRLGVVVDVEASASGERERLWDGSPPYRDRTTPVPPGPFFDDLRSAIEALGVEEAGFAADAPPALGQIALERAVLGPLRDAVARGELVATPGGLERAPAALFVRESEAEAFARLLASGGEAIEASARLARLVATLERTLPFRTTGAVNRHDVQRACVPLRGRSVGVHVLRGPRGTIELALFSRGAVLSRRRDNVAEPWRRDAHTDAAELARLLRAARYGLAATDARAEDPRGEAETLRETFGCANPAAAAPPLPGEQLVSGASASPGRAVGRAVLGTDGRRPEDLDGAVLLAPTLRPEHAPLLRAAAGVAATGGGILSHAGLLAAQYGRPALVVEGRWSASASGATRLVLPACTFREDESVAHGYRIAVRRDVHERELAVRDGDLVVLDADRGTLQLLGDDPDLLALYEGVRALGAARRRLEAAPDAGAMLALRGAMLRARHLVASALSRLGDPAAARFAMHEILLGAHLQGGGGGCGEKAGLLRTALDNPKIAAAARDHLLHLERAMIRRSREASDAAAERVPIAESLYEVLALRLEVLRRRETQGSIALVLRECGIAAGFAEASDAADVDRACRRRLHELRAAEAAACAAATGAEPRLRYRLRTLEWIDALIGGEETPDPEIERARQRFRQADAEAVARLEGCRVLDAASVGMPTAPLVGWKAANLAEIDRLAGPGRVPPWFVVTDAAFREALGAGLAAAIDDVLSRDDLDLRGKAAAIRSLWDAAPVSPALAAEIAEAYARLADAPWDAGSPSEGPPYVAVRSSAREEDTEATTNAGEFDTFLFVRGASDVVDHVRRAWAGLWNERALAARQFAGSGLAPSGGGVIVQRMVRARVSGVVQTIHVAGGNSREIVVNAGLGLGEGIVAGAVGADLITVAKEGNVERGPLRVRYLTTEKRQQVVFDQRKGSGTVRVETLYHQRLRPALEYVELAELVACAARLETGFGVPVDVEFAIEGSRLRLLQVRPVSAHAAALRDTLERHPLPVQEDRR